MASNVPPRTRPDAPRSLRPAAPTPEPPAHRSGETKRGSSPSPSPPPPTEAPPLWLARLGQELRERRGDEDVGVFALHLAHVGDIVRDVGALAGHRVLAATIAEVDRMLDGRGSCARFGAYDLLAFARRPAKDGTIVDLAEVLVDRVAGMSFGTAAGELRSAPVLACARWSEESADEHALVRKALRRLERAMASGRRAQLSDR